MDKLSWVWFQNAVGFCKRCTNRMVETVGSPRVLMEMRREEIERLDIFSPKEIQSLVTASADAAHRILESCDRLGYSIVTPDDEVYGERLRNIPLMPAVLYVQGKLKNFDDTPAMAMVGTRKMTEYGAKVACGLAKDLAASGFVVISGLAEGIDAQSHKGAVMQEGYTVAVIGCGLDIDYPRPNRALREMILENGAVVSEYPPGTAPIPANFPNRNRIISGMSDGVLVIEGNEFSGSMITAGHGLTQGKDIFAVPNSIYEKSSAGCFKLISQGAKMVCSVQDITDEYEARFGDKIVKPSCADNDDRVNTAEKTAGTSVEKTKRKQKPMPDYLTEEQKMIYAVLIGKYLTAQDISAETGMTLYQVLAKLTELEIYGVVKADVGGVYFLC